MNALTTGLLAALLATVPYTVQPPPGKAGSSIEAFLGTWEGTSTCTNLELTPACKNEHVIYEVSRGQKGGTVVVKADKVVNGERQWMGDIEMTYNTAKACWYSEIHTRWDGYWCFVVQGDEMTGTLKLMEGDAVTRDVQVRRK
jgi:hypothetical protein